MAQKNIVRDNFRMLCKVDISFTALFSQCVIVAQIAFLIGCSDAAEEASINAPTPNRAPTAIDVSITDDNGGVAVVGDSLTGSYTYNDVDDDAEDATSFRWLREGTDIENQTSSNYTLVEADTGQSITFEVTPVAATGVIIGSAVTSTAVVVGNSAPTASAVSITDDNGDPVVSAVVGDSLTGIYTYEDLDGDAEGSSTFQWLRDSAVIIGVDATSSTYTLVKDDSGKEITFKVTPVAERGTITGVPLVSITGVTVVNSAPTASNLSIKDVNGNIVVSAVVGDILTASYSYNDVDGDAEGSSTFQWLRDGAVIIGVDATSSTYTLVKRSLSRSLQWLQQVQRVH